MSQKLRPGFRGSHRRREFDVRISINSDGFRGRELRASAPETKRILALGDSYTFGWGVNDDEAWPARLEANLTNIDRPTEVINAGFASGFSPDLYYIFLRERLLELEPDLVIIGFFVGNDIDGYVHNVWIETDEKGLPLKIRNSNTKIDRVGHAIPARPSLAYLIPILRDSHLVHLLGNVYRQIRNAISPRRPRPGVFDVTYKPETERELAKTKWLFSHIAATTAAAGVPIMVVIIPTRDQVVGPSKPAKDLNMVKPNRIFRAFFEAEHIPYVGLLPKFLATDRRGELYYPRDIHWTPRGHEIAAAAIAQSLLSRFQAFGGEGPEIPEVESH